MEKNFTHKIKICPSRACLVQLDDRPVVEMEAEDVKVFVLNEYGDFILKVKPKESDYKPWRKVISIHPDTMQTGISLIEPEFILITENKSTTEGVYTYPDGSVYRGILQNKRPQGKGTIQFANGDIYKGMVENDRMSDSEGHYQWVNGTVYEGPVNGDDLSGKATIRYANKDRYEGWVKNGVPEATNAFYSFSDRPAASAPVSYEGGFAGGKFHGKGVLKWKDGIEYTGQFLNGEFTNGRIIYPNSVELIGSFRNNQPHGNCSILSKTPGSKWSYTNVYEEGIPKGTGKLEFENGVIIEATFYVNIHSGQGIILYPDGSRYKGDISRLMPNGKGHIQFSNQNIYKGNFEAGIFEGDGNYIWAKGSYYMGLFKNGKPDDKNGQIKWPDKSSFTGRFQDGKREGWGTMHYANGEIREGNWKNDKSSDS